METLKLSDLICGEIYYSEGYYGPYIFKFKKLAYCSSFTATTSNNTIVVYSKGIHTKPGWGNLKIYESLNYTHLNNLRKATTEEGLWLEACIKENKYLSKEEALKKTSTYPFEIGKWYKNEHGYKKFFKLEGIKLWYNEEIYLSFSNNKYRNKEDWCYNDNFELLKDLSEIQQYLPEEHPDKIKYTQLKVGDWVVVTRRYENNSAKVGNVCCISTIDVSSTTRYRVTDKNNTYNWSLNPTWCIDVRRATQAEIDSVTKPKELVEDPICETCNGTGQVMTAKLYPTGHCEVDEDCPDCDGNEFIENVCKPVVKEYPEYYEFIKEKATNFTKGKIYKIKDPSNLKAWGSFIDDSGHNNGYLSDNTIYFKPSTKEALDLQESKSKPITNMSNNKYKVGDIVDTNDEGWQYINFDAGYALNMVKSSILQNQIITNVEYSANNLNWWYSFSNGERNWHTESSIVGLSKEEVKELPNSSVIEDFQIKCNSEEESKLCEKWARDKGLKNQYLLSYTLNNWCYFKVQHNCYDINNTKVDNLKEKTLEDIGIVNTYVANTPNISNYNYGIDPLISNTVNPGLPKYNLSTTITRAIKENNPNIIARESGKSINDICEVLTDDYCRLSNFRRITKVNCNNSWCNLCKFHRDNNTLEQTKDWLKGVKSTTNPTLSNPIVAEFEITPITTSKEPDFTTINSIYDRIPDVEY